MHQKRALIADFNRSQKLEVGLSLDANDWSFDVRRSLGVCVDLLENRWPKADETPASILQCKGLLTGLQGIAQDTAEADTALVRVVANLKKEFPWLLN